MRWNDMRAALAAGAAMTASVAGAAAGPVDWTGIYLGGNVGYAWGHADVSWQPAPGFPDPNNLLPIRIAGSAGTMKPSSLTGGIAAGYNLQSGALLAGIEADVDYLNATASRFHDFVPDGFNSSVSGSVSLEWLLTARGRFGFAVDRYLVYATGGVAMSKVGYRDQQTYAAVAPGIGSSSQWRAGWTVGGGAEVALSDAWTAKAEYLHLDFGSTSYTATSSDYAPASGTHHHRLTADLVRVGVNYRFGR